MNSEVELLRGICKTLILRIFEAISVRDLLNESSLKESKNKNPNLIENLLISLKQNSSLFEDKYVNPIEIDQLSHFQNSLNSCDTAELVRLAEIARFIMEKEIYQITKTVIEKQS